MVEMARRSPKTSWEKKDFDACAEAAVKAIESVANAETKESWFRGSKAILYTLEQGGNVGVLYVMVSEFEKALKRLRNHPAGRNFQEDASPTFMDISVVLIQYTITKKIVVSADESPYRLEIRTTQYPSVWNDETSQKEPVGDSPLTLWEQVPQHVQLGWLVKGW